MKEKLLASAALVLLACTPAMAQGLDDVKHKFASVSGIVQDKCMACHWGGYDLPVYDEAVRALKARGLEVVTHMIAGLPGETREMTVETARYIGQSGADGIKIHLLHVLRGTGLAAEYEAGRVPVLTMEDYIETVAACLRVLPPDMVIHRLTGDGDKRTLLAPLWSADKKTVLNALNRALRDVEQGELL